MFILVMVARDFANFGTAISIEHGRCHQGCGGLRRTPHFCGVYPAGGTTQFTLYTVCGVLQLAALQKLRDSHSALALGNSASCTVNRI